MVLESPIKDLVERVHSYQQFNSLAPGPTSQAKKAEHKQADLLKKALENQNPKSHSQQINERTDVSVLNILLNQILIGKYSFDKSKIEDFARENLTERLDRFLKGINFKELLSEV